MNTTSRKLVLCILGIIVLFHFIANFVWLSEGPCLYGKDVAGHLKLTAKMYYQFLAVARSQQPAFERAIAFVGLFQEPASPFAEGTWVWPKLLHVYAGGICIVFGLSDMAMILSNVIWLAIALASITYLGSKIADLRVGLLAAFLLSFYPGVYGLSRQYGTDYPLIAMVAASMAILAGTDFLKRRAAFFGLVLGLGILVKAQVLFFVIPPFLYCLVTGLHSGRASGTSILRVIVNTVAALAVAAIISSVWWLPIARPLAASFVDLTSKDTGFLFSQSFKPFSPGWAFFYARTAAINISALFVVLFVLSFPFFSRSKVQLKAMVIIWLLGAYVIDTFVKAKSASYFFPAFPAVALITASGLMEMGGRRIRTFLIGVAVIGGLAQFWVFSFMATSFNPLPVDACSFDTGLYNHYFPPRRNNYGEVADNILDELYERWPSLEDMRMGMVELSGNIWQQNFSDIFEYYMRLRDPDFYLYRSNFNREAFLRYAHAFDFLVVMGRDEDYQGYLLGLLHAFPRGMVKAAFGDEQNFKRVVEGYGDYEVLGRWTLLPERLHVTLLGVTPVSLTRGFETPATKFFRSDMHCRFPLVGTSEALSAEKTEQDYDMFFPIEEYNGGVGKPSFSEYYISSNNDRRVYLEIEYASGTPVTADIFLDGDPIARDVVLGKTSGDGDFDLRWGKLSYTRIREGEHILRIESRSLPAFKALRIK